MTPLALPLPAWAALCLIVVALVAWVCFHIGSRDGLRVGARGTAAYLHDVASVLAVAA